MNFRAKTIVLLIAGLIGVLASCKDKWDEHSELTDPDLGTSLFQKIKQEPTLSKFASLLEQTKYDKVLASSKKYTVWAPSNDALANLSEAILNDEQKLKEFIGYYIVELPYNTNITDTLRLKTQNGKYIHFSKKSFEGASIISSNKYTGNGVLHIINEPVLPKQNIWDVIQASSSKQKDYLTSLNYEVIDSSLAEQIGVDPTTGKPIYKPGTGIVKKNRLFDRVGDLGNEGEEYTVFLLADNVLEAERNNIMPYTQGATSDETERLASLLVMKDLVFKGKYNLANLPAELVSIDGVHVPISRSAIQSTYETSNGIVHVVNQLSVPLANKIRNIMQEGEDPAGFSRSDKSANIFYRQRKNNITNQLFNDIYIYNHKIPLFHVKYRVKDVYSIKYKVYWVAPNDVQTLTFKQRFAFADPASTAFAETQVNLKNYNEVLVGEVTPNSFGDYNTYVVAANNGVDQTNSVNIDYFRLEPQLP